MGRRVPYPAGPSSPSPASGPPTDSSFSSPTSSYSSSSAFVSEPQSKPIQDTPTSPSTAPNVPPSDSPSTQQSSYTATASSFQDDFAEPPNSYFRQSDSPTGTRSDRTPSASTPNTSTYTPPSKPPAQESDSSLSQSANAFVQKPIAGLKSVLGKKKDRKNAAEAPEKPIGDDWGQKRTKEHINSWDANESEPSKLEEGAKNLFNFGRNVGANAGRLAEDIASGWNNQNTNQPASRQEPSGNEQGYSSNYDPRYDDARYDNRYDDLDQGWENFDDYSEPPSDEIGQKRTYTESLYDSDDRRDSGYVEEDAIADEIGPDGVYDADYRVIEPPSKPLENDSD